VPVVKIARREDRLGGAANVARNIVALGGHATLLGIVGRDEAGRSVAALASESGIEADCVEDESLPTTLKMRVLGRQQQLLRVDFEEHPSAASLDALSRQAESLIASHDVLVLSDYAKGALDRVEQL